MKESKKRRAGLMAYITALENVAVPEVKSPEAKGIIKTILSGISEAKADAVCKL